jgi:hypothetical protein
MQARSGFQLIGNLHMNPTCLSLTDASTVLYAIYCQQTKGGPGTITWLPLYRRDVHGPRSLPLFNARLLPKMRSILLRMTEDISQKTRALYLADACTDTMWDRCLSNTRLCTPG